MFLINARWMPLSFIFKKEIQSRQKKSVSEESFNKASEKIKQDLNNLQANVQQKLKNKTFQNIVNTNEYHELEIAVAMQIYSKILNSNTFTECYPHVKQLLYNYNYLEESFKGTVYALLLLANDYSAKENQVAEIYFELKSFYPDHEFKEAVLYSLLRYLNCKKVDFINRDYTNLIGEIKNETKDEGVKLQLAKNEETFLKSYFRNWKNIKQYNALIDIAKKAINTQTYDISTKIDACNMLIDIYNKLGIKELVLKYNKKLENILKKKQS